MSPKAEVKPAAGAGSPGQLNAGLLLARLETRILAGENLGPVRAVLQNEAFCRRLGIQERLRWAELAQMAQETDTALRVLAGLTRERPDCLAAWERQLALLVIIGPAEAFAGVLAQARDHIGAARHAYWLQSMQRPSAGEEKDLLAAAVPLDRHHQRQAALRRFLDLCSGREDCFARQWADRKAQKQGYVPERRPLGITDLEEHLLGRKTYGVYLMRADGRIRTAVIDADLNKALRGRPVNGPTRSLVRREAVHLIRRIKELSQAAGAFPLVEFSGAKGYHFWYFFHAPVACAPVRAALASLVEQVAPDLSAFHLEVFPKQDAPGGKGFGNLVKLPLGLHRATGKRSFFLDCADRSPSAQLDFLATVKPSDDQGMIQGLQPKAAAEVVLHPRWQQWADAYPELYRLQSACAPLAQAMSLCLEGGRLSLREEKILYQTIGFLADGRRLLHYLMAKVPAYNPHLVDYRLSRLRGTPLGCRRIHMLLSYAGPLCRFDRPADYLHPLLHIPGWREPAAAPAEKAADLASALARLRTAIVQVEGFLK